MSWDIFVDVVLDSVIDVLKMMPIMLAACFLADFIIARRKSVKAVNSLKGVITGALLGIIPQCGISTGFAQLYATGLVGLSVLMSVLIAGADEALIFAAGGGQFLLVGQIILTKIISGISIGALIYFVQKWRRVRSEQRKNSDEVVVSGYCGHGHEHGHAHEHTSSVKDILLHSVRNTLTITFYVFVSVLLINLIVQWVGFDAVEAAFAHTGPFQPVLAAVIGLIPSCAVSIFLTETYMSGFITFGALIAGLSSNTGYGIVVLFKTLPLKKALRLTALLVGVSIIIGEILYFVL